MPSSAEIADVLNRLVAAADRQRLAAAATRPDVNATDLLALDLIRRHPGISPGQLARTMQLTPGGTNGVIRRIIKAQLIVRRTSPTGRSDVRLKITPLGTALMTTGVGGWDPRLLDQLARLPAAEADLLTKTLAAITASAEQRASDLADLAADLNNPGRSVPLPVAWG
jgi:DNA-binding MarR family transcriptional regulator